MSDHNDRSPRHDNRRPRSERPDHGSGFFYWQLTPTEQAHLRAADMIRAEEGYLAHDINWGRQLLDAYPDPSTDPELDATWSGPNTSPEHVSDLISAVLQVAVDLGLDPEVVCDRALFTHRAVRRQAAEAVRRW